MATFNNGESLSSVRTKINDAIDKIDGNATISNDITVGGNIAVTGTVDGRDVAADGTKLDGINQGVATTDSPTFAGLTTTSDITFGDNDKAIFGAGSDLQIYHTGAASFISDQGTGRLKVLATDLSLNNAGDTANYIVCTDGGDVQLYHNGSSKLATTSTGIDVTGTVTADGLTIAPDANRSLNVSTDGTYSLILENTSTNSGADLTLKTKDDIVIKCNNLTTFRASAGGDISFYEDTGTTAKFFWDASAESLGIGTSSPRDVANYSIVGINGTSGSAIDFELGEALKTSLTQSAGQFEINVVPALPLLFKTSNTERMRIDSSGNVGIGTSSPAEELHIETTGGATAGIQLSTTGGTVDRDWKFLATAAAGTFYIQDATASVNRLAIDASGNVGIGTTSPDASARLTVSKGSSGGSANSNAGIVIEDNSNTYLNLMSPNGFNNGIYFGDAADNDIGYINYAHGTNSMAFGVNAAERMRIDSSGNLLVGTTSYDSNAEGVGIGADAFFYVARQRNTANTSQVAAFNRKGTDGNILRLDKDGTTVGSIGVNGGVRAYFARPSKSGITIGGGSALEPTTDAGNSNDATVDLGVSTNRFRDAYLSGGVVFGSTGGSVTSKTLDDYEEGTWTPTFSMVSGSASFTYQANGQKGYYTKIGNQVTVWFIIHSAGVTVTTDGDVRISGLPFTSADNHARSYSIGFKQLLDVNEVGLLLSINPNTSRIELYEGHTNYPESSRLVLASDLGSDRRIRGTMTYMV